MSHIEDETVTCPACGAQRKLTIFSSLNGERVAAQVQKLLDDTFERITCECGHSFRPEHRMLYAHYALRTWVVMYPRAERANFRELERGVEAVFERDFSGAPNMIAAGLRGTRPRLVFGQSALSEAVRVSEWGFEPALLECAKLLLFRRNLAVAMGHGPAELLYEGLGEGGALQFGVVGLDSGARLDTLIAPRTIVDEVTEIRADLVAAYPALFSRAFVSATRYLFGTEG